MGLNLQSYPQAVFKQATAPSNVTSGALWWDTDDLLLYYYTGTNWVQISSASDAAGYEQMVAQLALEILRLSAEGTLTAPDYDSIFVDYFADASGQDNTIDTGAGTTATFQTDLYKNGLGEVTDAHGQTMAATYNTTGKSGVKITMKANTTLTSVTKPASTTATKCYLCNSSASVLDTQTFSSNVATFNQSLTSGTTYYILVDAEGSAYDTARKNSAPTYPIVKTAFNYITARVNAADEANDIFGITSITTDLPIANKVVKTNAQALSFAPAYCLIHVKDKTIAGSGSITYDISFDSGSTWDSTGNVLDKKIAVSDGSAKNMVIKLNLNGTGAGNTATIKDYEVILWSS